MEIIAEGDLGGAEILLEVDYSRDDIPAGMNEKNLRLFRYNEDHEEWELLPNQEVDTENKVIKVWLTDFSEFAVLEYEEAAVENGDDDEEDLGELPETGAFGSWFVLVGMLLILAGTAFQLRIKEER